MSPAAVAANPLGLTRVLGRRRSGLVTLCSERMPVASEEGAPRRLRAPLSKGRLGRPRPRRPCGHRRLPPLGGGVGTEATLPGLFSRKVEFAVFNTFLPLSEEWDRNASVSKM